MLRKISANCALRTIMHKKKIRKYLRVQYELHLKEKDLSRQEKRKDKEMAENNEKQSLLYSRSTGSITLSKRRRISFFTTNQKLTVTT